MDLEEFSIFLDSEVQSHLEWLNALNSFHRFNDDLSESLVANNVATNLTDGLEIIENILLDNPELIEGQLWIPLPNGRWRVNYNNIHEAWIFEKDIEYEMIIDESYKSRNGTRIQLAELIKSLSPTAFEYLIFAIFDAIEGYHSPQKRTETRDGGYEMSVVMPNKLTGTEEFVLIQAKHQSGKVSVSQVRELIGTLDTMENTNRNRSYSGLMVSLREPTTDARKTASSSTKTLDFLDLDGIIDVMIRYKIGWVERELNFAKPETKFWEELDVE